MKCLATLLGCLFLGSTVQAQVEVRFASPDSSTPVFGEVEVLVRVDSVEPVDRVELTVDGRPAGVIDTAPFLFRVDVGEDNAEHRFEALAIDRSGRRGTAVRQTPPWKIDEEINLDLQQAYVTVTGRGDKRILGLSKSDFEIYDNDQRQQIVTLESGDIPFTAVLLLDASVSMKHGRMAAARLGARRFVNDMEELDEAAIVAFSDRLVSASPFSADAEVLGAELETIQTAGGTAINDHLFFALRRLESRHGRRVVVLLSHGQEIHSVLRIQQVREVARRSQAQIYWIRLVDPRRPESRGIDSWRDAAANNRQDRQLKATIKESGGRILRVARDDIEAAFAEVLQELREQYAIGYYPSEDRDDGSWRTLRVELQQSGLTARSGDGYLDY